jgi:hypothetical protein
VCMSTVYEAIWKIPFKIRKKHGYQKMQKLRTGV